MKRVKLLIGFSKMGCRHSEGDKFDIVEPPASHAEHYPNTPDSVWVILDNGKHERLVRQRGFMQFEFTDELGN